MPTSMPASKVLIATFVALVLVVEVLTVLLARQTARFNVLLKHALRSVSRRG